MEPKKSVLNAVVADLVVVVLERLHGIEDGLGNDELGELSNATDVLVALEIDNSQSRAQNLDASLSGST